MENNIEYPYFVKDVKSDDVEVYPGTFQRYILNCQIREGEGETILYILMNPSKANKKFSDNTINKG